MRVDSVSGAYLNVRDVVVALADAPVRALDGRRREGTAWALMGFIVSVLYWSSLNDGALMALNDAFRDRGTRARKEVSTDSFSLYVS